MSTVPSADAKAVVRALEGLSTQLRRALTVGAQQEGYALAPPVVDTDDGATTTVGRPVEWLRDPAANGRRCTCDYIEEPWIKMEHAAECATRQQPPADDERQAERWARREPLLVLLTRLQRGRTLTPAEADTLRHIVETEMRDNEQLLAEQAACIAAEQRADAAERDLRVLRSGLRAAGGDPTQIQNLWAQIRLRNRQWRETKRELAVTRSMLESEGGDVSLVDEMVRTVAQAEGEAREAQAAIERVRRLVTGAAQTTAAGLSDHDIGRYDMAVAVLAALDGTAQPTTEQP